MQLWLVAVLFIVTAVNVVALLRHRGKIKKAWLIIGITLLSTIMVAALFYAAQTFLFLDAADDFPPDRTLAIKEQEPVVSIAKLATRDTEADIYSLPTGMPEL